MAATLPELFFFDAAEQDLVARVLDLLEPAARAPLRASLDWLARLARLVVDCPAWAFPSLDHADPSDAALVTALIDHLGTVSDHDVELHIPTKAVLGQAYLVAKINFLKAMIAATREVSCPPEIATRLHHELGQSIYSRLAEELFLSIVIDGTTPAKVVQAAGALLHRIWESRLLTEVDDFAPLLEAAWEARNKVRPVLGTMLGSHEIFRLFQEARDDRFLDYFSGEEVSEEQREAFEEFLFDLAHEEITRLRAHMSAHKQGAVSLADAAQILGKPALAQGAAAGHDDVDGPQALYASYKDRKIKASYRALTSAHGPKHTAEEYVMLAFLSRG